MKTVAENYQFVGLELKEVTGVSTLDGQPSLTGIWQNDIFGWRNADLDMINGNIDYLMRSHGIKGASFALVRDEKLIFADEGSMSSYLGVENT